MLKAAAFLDGYTPSAVATANFVLGNQAPVLNPIGDKTAEEGQPISFTVTASDPDLGPPLSRCRFERSCRRVPASPTTVTVRVFSAGHRLLRQCGRQPLCGHLYRHRCGECVINRQRNDFHYCHRGQCLPSFPSGQRAKEDRVDRSGALSAEPGGSRWSRVATDLWRGYSGGGAMEALPGRHAG